MAGMTRILLKCFHVEVGVEFEFEVEVEFEIEIEVEVEVEVEVEGKVGWRARGGNWHCRPLSLSL